MKALVAILTSIRTEVRFGVRMASWLFRPDCHKDKEAWRKTMTVILLCVVAVAVFAFFVFGPNE